MKLKEKSMTQKDPKEKKVIKRKKGTNSLELTY
jgi:hypothetical protein